MNSKSRSGVYALYAGRFDGKPAFIAECSTLSEFADEGDENAASILVTLFDSEDELRRYVDSLLKR
jgi:hypothetical protein